MTANLYVHFPFCRSRCSYCVLHSRAGSDSAGRIRYVQGIASDVARLEREGQLVRGAPLSTVYFGGGSPALCDLRPVFSALEPFVDRAGGTEFTVELHPLDVTRDALAALRDGGVNRISMGVQSLDDEILADMRRGCTADDAARAFALVREFFDNAGIDLIVGYPSEKGDRSRYECLASWGVAHCSLYSLILEPESILAKRIERGKSAAPPDDDRMMDELARVGRVLESIGLERYEISSDCAHGRECRHNLATWRGEDYIGLGEGAYGRVGLKRTYNPPGGKPQEVTELDEAADLKERTFFRLRTREGIDASRFPQWLPELERCAAEGLLVRIAPSVFRLTARGCEVCDSILESLC